MVFKGSGGTRMPHPTAFRSPFCQIQGLWPTAQSRLMRSIWQRILSSCLVRAGLVVASVLTTLPFFPLPARSAQSCCATDREVKDAFSQLTTPRNPNPAPQPPPTQPGPPSPPPSTGGGNSGGGGNPSIPPYGPPLPPRGWPPPLQRPPSRPGPIVITVPPAGSGRHPTIEIDPSRMSREDLANVFRELLKNGISYDVKKTGYMPPSIPGSIAATPSASDPWQVMLTNQNLTNEQLVKLRERLDLLVDYTAYLGNAVSNLAAQQAKQNSSRRLPAGSNTDSPIDPPQEFSNAQPEQKDPVARQVTRLVKSAAYKNKDDRSWIQVAEVPADKVNAAGRKNSFLRRIYWNAKGDQRGTIRVAELTNAEGKLTEVLILAKSHRAYEGRQWLAYVYRTDAKTGKLSEQNMYFGSPIPNACLNCHGGPQPKNFSPAVTAPDYRPHGWFFR